MIDYVWNCVLITVIETNNPMFLSLYYISHCSFVASEVQGGKEANMEKVELSPC